MRRRRSEEEERKEEKNHVFPPVLRGLAAQMMASVEPWLNTSPEHIQQAQHCKRDAMCFPVCTIQWYIVVDCEHEPRLVSA